MTQEQKDKKAAINRINDRYRQIVIKFGEDSAPAKEYRAKMIKLGGDYMTESGYISKSKEALDSMKQRDIWAMEMQPTAMQIEEQVKEHIKTVEEQQGVTAENVKEYYEIKKRALNMLDSLGDYESQAFAEYREKHGKPKGKLTYNEIIEAINEYKDKKSNDQSASGKAAQSAKEIFNTGKPQATIRVSQPRSENMRTQGVTNKV